VRGLFTGTRITLNEPGVSTDVPDIDVSNALMDGGFPTRPCPFADSVRVSEATVLAYAGADILKRTARTSFLCMKTSRN
jgi:hypothetical protein